MLAAHRDLPLAWPKFSWNRGSKSQGGGSRVHASIRCLTCTHTHGEYIRFAQVRLRHAVIGRDRLPTFADAPLLTYVRPIIEGIIRWHSGVPTVLAHAAEDDWYEGMPIPERHRMHTQRLALRP